jgi:tRNA-specific 2-thiouridylase
MAKKLPKQKTVFIGLSGGVDSSVAAYLLKKKGYNVIGVFIKSWYPPGFPCPYPVDRRDAIRVCAKLGIPFLEMHLEKVYKREVTDYLVREYEKGRTPNPDVMCNKFVKFGAFFEAATARGADFFATGHYARVKNGKLYQARDKSKDQSYFLWPLTENHLKKTLFPVGELLKKDVRKLAKKIGLPTAAKADSQGICFLGEFDIKDFLKNYLKVKRGSVCNENREVIGWHEGAYFYTLGERHGFTITKKTPSDKPYYIIAKDIKKNTLTVSHNPELNRDKKVKIEDTNWLVRPKLNKIYTARFRHLGQLKEVKINKIGKTTEVFFSESVRIAPGQSLVLYDGEKCLGGGIVL